MIIKKDSLELFTIRDAISLAKNGLIQDAKWVRALCEDGVTIITNSRALFMTSFYSCFHEAFPNLPFTSRHTIDHVLKGGVLNRGTSQELLSILVEDVCTCYRISDSATMTRLMQMCIDTNVKIQNIVTGHARDYVFSINIFDMLELINHPVMVKTFDDVINRRISIKESYNITSDFIRNDPSVARNSAVIAARAKMLNENQIMQCIMVRGYTTEVNGEIMANPVMTNFTKGLNTLHAFVAESRSAAKAYYFAEDPIQKAEYFARRLQLLTMSVERVHHGEDCGSTNYIDWLVNPPKKDKNGNTIYPGDLVFMTGIFYLDEELGTLRAISKNDTHLYGKTIKMRSIITCKHHDKHGVCHVCFGDLAKNIPATANLGHLCGCVMTQQTTQSVLSTKHLDASSVAVDILLSQVSRIYFDDPNMHQHIKLKKVHANTDLVMVIDRDEARGLTELKNFNKGFSKVNCSRLSNISRVEIRKVVKGVHTTDLVQIAQSTRMAHLTSDFLEFARSNHYDLDENGNYVFELKHWNVKQPIFQFVKKEQNFSQHSQQVATIIESSVDKLSERLHPNSPAETLRELFDLVNSKLKVHLSCLQVIIYACMVPDNNSYGMARGAPAPMMGIHSQLIRNRSLSAQYLYEHLPDAVADVNSFYENDRPDHPMDVIFAPYEVIKAYYD